MLNWRLYRAAFLPVLFALAIAAFSLAPRPRPLTSTLAPDAFDGARAFGELDSLARQYPDRRPGSRGDAELARHISSAIQGLGNTAGGGFTVHTSSFTAQSIRGERTLTSVIAKRPGSTSATPIVILAHRDAAAVGNGRAQLSGTAALLELARVFAARETRRTIVLVSTSGGSGGDAGAANLAAHRSEIGQPGLLDAAIVLGDLAGSRVRTPLVVPFSDGFGSASLQLQRTVDYAITQQTGSDPGAPSPAGQLAHFAFPLTVGEQGPLDAAGIPAVLVSVSGESGPSSRQGVSEAHMESFGRAVLSAVDALDAAPDVATALQTGVLVQHQTIPAWAVRMLTAALLLGPLILALDGVARARRRRRRASRSVGRWTLWTLTCALPFFLVAVFAWLLGRLGVIGAAPSAPVPAAALPFDGAAATAVVAAGLVLALAWLLWPVLLRRLGLTSRPDPELAGLSILLVLLTVCVVAWMFNPFAALLLLPALHLWLPIASPELRPRPLGAIALVGIALLPLVLLVSFYIDQLGLGPGETAWTAVLLLAGGHVGVPAAALWSLAFGCVAAVAMLVLSLPAPPRGPEGDDDIEVTTRGPVSYAGPGSLGGTESALRR
jgi:peptidase M28-like protein